MSLMDDPNREAVGLEPVGLRGDQPEPKGFDDMTKAELIEHAEAVGIEIDDTMKKDEIRELLG